VAVFSSAIRRSSYLPLPFGTPSSAHVPSTRLACGHPRATEGLASTVIAIDKAARTGIA